ncbi:hypothetical protein LOTGIDRAFT_61259, partial [Lottia gigantea]
LIFFKEIGPESPANNRIKRIHELSDIVKDKRLEENAVEALLVAISDILQKPATKDAKIITLEFIKCLLLGQINNLGILRGHFFHIIDDLPLPEEWNIRFELFNILSENGRNLHDFEDETGPFLLRSMPDILSKGKISEYLSLLINVIKFNAAYLDEETVSSLVQQTCMIPNRSRSEEDMKLCMEVLDAVVCYSYLPVSSLHHFIAALCRLVNIAKVCKESWKLMRKLLGTHLGHSSIYTMCCMLQDRSQPVDGILLRGAVFFIGMALWGSSRVQSLKQSQTTVLPSFLQALNSRHSIVGHEVVLSIQRLVKKYGKELQNVTWDIILSILEKLIEQYEVSLLYQIQVEIHDVLTTIETLHESRQYLGSVPRFFQIIEHCAHKRSVHSISLLIDYHAQFIHPIKEKWIVNLNSLLERFFRQESRTDIRKKALDILSFVLSINKHIYEADLIEMVVLPNLRNIDTDPDTEVRQSAAHILLVLAQTCNSDEFFEIMTIIEKVNNILSSPIINIDNLHSIIQIPTDDQHYSDVKATTFQLIEVFKVKLYQSPSSHGVRIYEILIDFLTTQYHTIVPNYTAASMRKAILECLLELRADNLHRLGIADKPKDVQYPFSPYILCYCSEEEPEPVIPPSPGGIGTNNILQTSVRSVIDYTQVFTLFIICLKKELDWEVLKAVLNNLPIVLQNKTLILSTEGDLIDELCHHLASMVNDRMLRLPEKLNNLPSNFTKSDFHTFVFPVLAAMVTYHDYLDRARQRELIKCLEFGLVSKCAKGCVSSLRICTLEMQDVMMRQLPSVLLSLSKISATISMAIPVLAFLSSIVRLPKLYANFVEDQYMSVFAIALPYTNPFKFSHYTVSLAHHVIAVWFIRCRLPFRKGFVKFIQKGLKANVLQQFEENARINLKNQDSSDRNRSGSYTAGTTRTSKMVLIEQLLLAIYLSILTPPNKKTFCSIIIVYSMEIIVADIKTDNIHVMVSGSAISQGDKQPPIESKMSQFHKELTETCTDMMARYTFGNVSTTPKRSAVAQFLLKGGQNQTWLVGNKIITITTSGGSPKTSQNGLCEKCLVLYQETQDSRLLSGKKSRDRRRNKSTACLSRSHSQIDPVGLHGSEEGDALPKRSQDDLSLINDDAFSSENHDDVGVQTGSSLIGSDKDPIESLFLGRSMPEKRAFSMNQCNCWCTGWAEILIRAPSGNISWMMRIENETSIFSQPENISDITLLFAPLYKSSSCEETSAPMDVSPRTLRKTNSSPSIIGSQPEDGFLRDLTFSPPKSDTDTDTIEQVSPKLSSHNLPKLDLMSVNSNPEPSSPDPCPSPRSSPTKRAKTVARTLSNSLIQDTIEEHDNNVEFYCQNEIVSDKSEVPISPNIDVDTNKLNPLASVLNAEQKHPSDTSHTESTISQSSATSSDDIPEMITIKPRGHTISVMSPAQDVRQREDVNNRTKSDSLKDSSSSGISPGFVFLQLFHNHPLLSLQETPVLLPQNETMERALRMLNHIHPYETHKIGVVYVGPGQADDEKAILSNLYGSERYAKFVEELGNLICLRNIDPDQVYTGGLASQGEDGQFAYSWQDDAMQVIFHIATLMPNKKSDPNGNSKKRHIGNDYVTIIYNDSQEDYKIGIIKGSFNYVNIVIKPLDYESNAVTLLTKEDIADSLGHKDTKIISDDNLAQLVRQIAMHCNLASMVLQRQQSQPQDPFASNWLERLRQIKRIKQKVYE